MPSAANGALRRHQKDAESAAEGSPKRLTNTAARASAPPNGMSEDQAATGSLPASGPVSSSQQKAVASSDSAMEVNGSSSSPAAPQDDSSYQPSSSQQTDMSLDAAKQVIEAARTALATSDEPLVPQGDSSRNGRRAATSPSFAAGLLDKATTATTAAAAVQAATTAQHPLTTEILPAPPRLPFDPTYPPLDPDAPPAPVHAPNSMAAAASHPIILPNGVVVQPVPAAGGAGAASGPSSSSNSSADKKRKQPSFALQKPEGYDSKVPYALYAIVNGLPEADNKAKAGGRRKQVKGTKQAARTSRSSTPVVPRADGASSNGASGAAAEAASANGAQADRVVDAASSPLHDDMLVDGEPADPAGSALVGDEKAPGPATPAAAPLLKINGASTTEDAASVSSPLSSSPSSPPPPFSSSSPSSSSNLDRPHPSASDRHMAEAEAEEAARAAASSSSGAIGDANDLATVPSLDSPQATINATTNAVKTPKTTSKKGKKAQQQQLQKGQSKLSFALATANSSTGEKAAAPGAAAAAAAPAAPQQLGAQSGDDHSDGALSSPASTSKIDTSGNVAPATPIAAAAATTNELMSSRASTPASTSSALTPVPPDSSSASGIAGGNGTGSSSLLGAAPGGGARPTRAAVAKVAARGSYYDPSTYATATPPPQAAVVHGLSAGGEAGSTSTNGAPSSSATGSRKGRKSAAGAGAGVDAKGKGRESAAQVGAGNGLAAAAGGLPLDATIDGGNEEFCSTCFGTGHFICCDSCPRSFHFACVNPPLDINEVPLDDDEAWHCQSCSALRHPPPAPLKATSSSKAAQSASAAARAFSHLNHHASTTNPTLFSLPPDVKNFFKGVGSERDGSFLDTSKLRTLKTDKKGLIEERDPFRLKDAKGKQVLCFSCGKSALPGSRADDASVASTSSGARGGSEWRRIISCDYCSLHWHLDCLDPPLASMPSQFRRWKCPCHIEDLLEHTRIPKSSAQVQVIDLPVPTVKNVGMRPGQFYRPRVLNSGQIDIVPDPLDTYWSSTGAGGAAGGGAGGTAEASGGAGGTAEASGRGLHRGWTNMEIPQADALIPGGGMRKIKFRLPEKVVRTDWWMKVLDGSGGRERLVDADAVDVATAVAATQGRFANGLDFLASVAAERLGPTEQQQQAEQQVDDEQLIRVALNGSAPASVRLAPLSEHVKDPPTQPAPQGELPNGGVLKKEENDELPASDLRSTIGMEGELDVKKKTEVAVPVKRAKSGNDSGSSSDSELSDVDEDAAAEAVHRKKRTKVDMDVDIPAASVEPAAAAQAGEEEDLDSLRAIRELMRRKGKDELLAFLRS